ncbi:Asp-tRNA(Asn)/Glu-tRNA(Gln) amidotransferase subunit GatB, partial [Pseudomonas aeruginosa]
YTDLPKGYQTSEMENTIVGKGHIDITMEDGTTKRIGITRAQLKEKAGKSLKEKLQGMRGIELNRAGTTVRALGAELHILRA